MMDKPAWGTPLTPSDLSTTGTMTLTVPAEPGFVHMLRSMASGAAVRIDLTYDELEDLTLAVSEASAYLLRLQPQARLMSLSMTVQGDNALEVMVAVDGGLTRTPTPDQVEWMMWHVLGALTGGASLTQEADGPAIHFVKSKGG
jgi:serine/threonine-protein kinase RsbW